MENRKPMIHVKDIRKVYQMGDEKVVALNRINLKIYRGEICCIFGTSGSGKSTLLNQLAGMEKPTRGEVLIRGINVSRMNEEELAKFRQEYIGFIFQSYNLLPTMTAIENVALPLMFCGMERQKREAIAGQLLCKVGLGHRLDHYPGQMSGGQQQRAGIARAFVTRPQVVFADEPTGNLDSKTTTEIMKMITGFARRYRQTIILVTHDPGMSRYADRIVTLVDGNIIGDERKGVEI
ncbi:MAG: ABC transporter ATP-binding protein [Clostridium sp.]|nr:ABC transporter ATP-binding protein [Clostridium sp.]